MFDFLFNKPKYYVILLKKNNNSYDVLKQRRIKDKELKTNTISYSNKTFLIDTSNICYTKGIKHYVIIDIDESQLTLLKQKTIISADMIDKILNKSIITQFTSALNTGTKTELTPVIIALITLFTGILLGYLIGNIYSFEELSNAIKNFRLW
jgi:hypothetical protein